MTKIHITSKWTDVKPKGFYVYLHRKNSDGSIFYVGKGSVRRAWDTWGRNSYWNRVAEKHGVTVEIVKDGMSCDCAMTLEKIIIYSIRKSGAKISNITDGGEGYSNKNPWNKRDVFSSLGESFPSISHASKYLRDNGFPKANSACIGNVINGRKISAYGRSWSIVGIPEHPAFVGRASTEKYACDVRSSGVMCSNGMSFRSLRKAAEWLRCNGWPSATHSNISMACRGIYDQCYGYKWSLV